MHGMLILGRYNCNTGETNTATKTKVSKKLNKRVLFEHQ